MSKQLYFKQFSLVWICSLNAKTVLSQTTQFSSIWPINRTLSGATIAGQSGPGSDGNKGVLRIPQSSSITETSPSDCLVSYQDTRLGVGLTPHQSVYSTVPADWAMETLIQTIKIYSHDIEIEFDIEKSALLIMKSVKREITEGIELPNKERIRRLWEK